MTHIPTRLREKIAALGRLSRPLGDDEARRFATSIIGSVSRELAANGNIEPILDLYEVRLTGEIEKAAAAKRKSFTAHSPYEHVSRVLPTFAAAERFDAR